MDRPSASVRIKLGESEVEISGSEEFVSDHIGQMRKIIRSHVDGVRSSARSRKQDSSPHMQRREDEQETNLSRNGYREQDETKNPSSDRSHEQSGTVLPRKPEAVFREWRAQIHSGYISKYLLTLALGHCQQDENNNDGFTVSELRSLYNEIGTTANVRSDLRKAQDKHLVRVTGKTDDARRYEITSLGKQTLHQSFAE